MAEWKLKKSFGHTRIKSQLKEHPRNKSQMSQKLLNPWDLIGQALTQRYNRKFMELEKLEHEQKVSSSIDGMNPSNTPKFQIKRKYLSFDYKGRENLETSCDLKAQFHLERLKKIDEKGRLTVEHKPAKQPIQSDRKPIINKNNHMKTQQTAHGLCFVPNSGHKTNYKCIYVKKNRKKIGFNPQLHISLKKTQAKSIQYTSTDFESEKQRKNNKGYHHDFSNFSGKKILNALPHKVVSKEKKMFRPWSGYSDEQNT